MLLWISSTRREKDANLLRRKGKRVRRNRNLEEKQIKRKDGETDQREAAAWPQKAHIHSSKDQRRARLSPSIPPVDYSRLVRNDRTQRLTHTH